MGGTRGTHLRHAEVRRLHGEQTFPRDEVPTLWKCDDSGGNPSAGQGSYGESKHALAERRLRANRLRLRGQGTERSIGELRDSRRRRPVGARHLVLGVEMHGLQGGQFYLPSRNQPLVGVRRGSPPARGENPHNASSDPYSKEAVTGASMGSFCSYLWDSVYINRSGEAFACCHQKPKPFGNIHEAPLRELIKSPAALQLRRDSLNGVLSCYPTCNLLDKSLSKPWGHEAAALDYDSLKRLHISFGEACNIRCVMCDNPQRHKDNPILLDPNLVIRNVDLAPFTTIMLRGGEPLYLPECLSFMDHLERVGKRYTILTNGILIDEKRAERLARHAHSVIVSLNGATKRGHESVNRGSRFERVLQNVQRMKSARDALGSAMILVGHMTITTSNIHEIPLFLRSSRAFGFDRVNFGFVKETVPPYLATHPEFTSQLRQDTTCAMNEVGGPDVDALRLHLLGLWNPASLGGTTNSVTNSVSFRTHPALNDMTELQTDDETAAQMTKGNPVIASLQVLRPSTTVLAFIRHAERERTQSPANIAMDQVPLTQRGRELARRFGRELPATRRVTVSHTSIPRSIQTAEEIDIGFRESNPSSGNILVGKDSMFSVIYRGTVDKQLRDTYRASLRGQAFTQLWLDGQVPPTVMRPAQETLSQFLRDVTVRVHSAPEGSLHVHVGHDREVEVVRTAVLGGRLGDYPLIDYLDGLVFSLDRASGIRVWWRDKIVELANSTEPNSIAPSDGSLAPRK